MSNKVKQEKYAILMTKLKKATSYEYYYEAILISYAVIDDRITSMLKHAYINVKDREGKEKDLCQKIKMLRSKQQFNNAYCKKHLTKELIDDIDEFRRMRNDIVHKLFKIEYDPKKIKKDALKAEILAHKISNKSTLINKYLDEHKKDLFKCIGK